MSTTVEAKKVGAGFFVVSEGEALLLLRGKKSGNPLTWGLPGGNVDEGETAIQTALREAEEELGEPIPNYDIKSEVVTTRGKKGDKIFTVFLVQISPQDKQTFRPKLNKEHVEYKWFSLPELQDVQNPHPIVKTLLQDHRPEVEVAFQPRVSENCPFGSNVI